CFEVHFGAHDGGAEVEQDAAFEALDRGGEDEEVAIAGGAQGRAIAVGVLVDDVVTDAGVNGEGNTSAPGGGRDREIAVRVGAFVNAAADVFAEAERAGGGFADPVVQLAGFLPETEFAGADV